MDIEKKNRIYKGIMLVAVSVFITFIVTSIGLYTYFRENSITKTTLSSIISDQTGISSKIQNIRRILDKYYLGDINENDLEDGAIKGYVEGLGDPYTEYISEKEMKEYMSDTMGNYDGIGIYMVKNLEYDKVQVLSTIKGTPAEKAGIQSGDLITKVDGKTYSANDMTEMANNIRGDKGTKVKIEIIRNKSEKKEFELTRSNIIVNQVKGKVLSNNIGYIEFSSFDEKTAEDFKKEFENLQKKGIKSLIIDLRNNGGGIVDTALKITDYIADKGSVLLYEVDKNQNESVKKAKEDPIIKMPIVILVNENTASASEILSGALHDLGKAKIVGTKTYGKGVIQQILQITDGSGIKVTIEEYLTPNRNKINKIGLKPDYEVKLPKNKSIYYIKESEDTQLKKAIEILK